jgi:hypothetical protein
LPLLCSQHWAQAAKDHRPRRMGTFVLNFECFASECSTLQK